MYNRGGRRVEMDTYDELEKLFEELRREWELQTPIIELGEFRRRRARDKGEGKKEKRKRRK